MLRSLFPSRAAAAMCVILGVESALAFMAPMSPALSLFAAGVDRGSRALAPVAIRRRNQNLQSFAMAARFTEEQIKAKQGAAASPPLEDLDPQTRGARNIKTVVPKVGRLVRAIKKPNGSISVIGEIKRTDPAYPGSAFPIPDMTEASCGYYLSKVHAVGVWADAEQYGCGLEDARTVVAAQQGYKGSFPGPCAVLACDLFLEEHQLAAVAKTGAAGALLSCALLGDKLAGMVTAATGLALDSVVLCESADELAVAAKAGAKLLALDTRVMGVDAAIAVAETAAVQCEVLIAAGGIKEIQDAWRLRDAGFGSVMIGEMLLTAAYGKEGEVRQGGGKEGMGATVMRTDTLKQDDLNSLVRGLTIKASLKYGPTSAGAFKEKGAKFKKHYEV